MLYPDRESFFFIFPAVFYNIIENIATPEAFPPSPGLPGTGLLIKNFG